MKIVLILMIVVIVAVATYARYKDGPKIRGDYD